MASPAATDRGNRWILLAIASGACAAFNGVFAKLTTTQLTTTFSQGIANLFGLSAFESIIEYVIRAIFFGLNLVFNGIMWTLFTKALARGNSTTQVSIMNTSSNFVITAVLGSAIFSESLPPLWWLGAAMLVAGNVIIGRKDESAKADDSGDGEGESSSILSNGPTRPGTSQDAHSLHGVVPEPKAVGEEGEEEEEDIIDLGDSDSEHRS